MQIKKTLTPGKIPKNACSCLGSRYYNPRESVWLSVDPLATYDPFEDENFIDGEHNNGVFNSFNNNPYIYCYQNPVILIDPNGKQVLVEVIPEEVPLIEETMPETLELPRIELPRVALPRVALPRIEPLDIDPLLPPPAIKLDFGKIAKSDKIEYANDLERAQDKLDGIQKAQNNNKKNAPQGQKQNKINSTKKSEQMDKYWRDRIDIDNIDEFNIKVVNPPQKQDQIQINTNKPTPMEQKILNKKEQERINREKAKSGQISEA